MTPPARRQNPVTNLPAPPSPNAADGLTARRSSRHTPSQRPRRGYRRSASPYGLGSATTAATSHQPTRSGNINTNNNRREVGPLQASAAGPLQTAAPMRTGIDKESGQDETSKGPRASRCSQLRGCSQPRRRRPRVRHKATCAPAEYPVGGYRLGARHGTCYALGTVDVHGGLTVAPGALLDALSPASGGVGSGLPGTVNVAGGIRVGAGAALLLGCGPSDCNPPLGPTDDRVAGGIVAVDALAVIVHSATIDGGVSIIGGGGGPAVEGVPASGECFGLTPPAPWSTDPNAVFRASWDSDTPGGVASRRGLPTSPDPA